MFLSCLVGVCNPLQGKGRSLGATRGVRIALLLCFRSAAAREYGTNFRRRLSFSPLLCFVLYFACFVHPQRT